MRSHALQFLRLFLVASMLLLATHGLAMEPERTSSGTVKPNRLIGESSPYLRQHAHNPVDWYPWGEEAFERARLENKPIFLSIGYSTCHWCHVMAREAFSDAEVARLLNEGFISIKVDREERPDVDRLYMTFVQASTGGGGWPLSVWLTPDLKPFVGGTYFSIEDHGRRPGFKTMLARISSLWAEDSKGVLRNSGLMLDALAADLGAGGAKDELPLAKLRSRAFGELKRTFDSSHGGFGPAPKFPIPVNIELLLDIAATSTDAAQRQDALDMATATLRAMAAGGIHDQLGGGFHRYSVDGEWRVPHFEKMLYDQAQIANACLTAWQLAADPVLRDAAVDTLRYVRDRMTGPDGAFLGAEDADSALATDSSLHGEGAYYVWTLAELESLLGADDARLFAFAYGARPDGNMAGETGPGLEHANVLFRAHDDAAVAAEFSLPEAGVRARLGAARSVLLAAREGRPEPHKDDKIVTSWNGLAISAFARAEQILGDPEWGAVAARAAFFLQGKLIDPATGRLAHSYRDGVRNERGFAEDYAFLIQGLLDLYEGTFETHWLEWALQLQETQDGLFGDDAAGGYFASAAGDPGVVLRLKEDNDGAEPSANSIAVRNLARLGALLHREDLLALARRASRAFGPQLDRVPLSMPQMLVSAAWLEGSPKQILIQGELSAPATRRLIEEVRSRFIPRRVIALIDGSGRPFFSERVPLIAGFPEEDPGGATAYVCEDFVCQMPTNDPATLAGILVRQTPGQP